MANRRAGSGAARGGSPVVRLTRAFQEFFREAAASSILLLAAALVAFAWANSTWKDGYADLWATQLTIGFGEFSLTESLLLWINDALMAIFFFVVGLEIKRELLIGELASPRRAALPVAAAVGGVVVPALIFLGLNWGTAGERGWGVPMATDIAFALGILALVGGPTAFALRVFLAALAIIDDLRAVLVIAVFYTADLSFAALGIAMGLFAVLVGLNRLGVSRLPLYLAVGAGLWLAVLEAGVHPTVAGVLLAMTIPSRVRAGHEPAPPLAPAGAHDGGALLHRLELRLHPWVAFAILPIFALANAGVTIQGGVTSVLGDRITLGVIAGLVIGKQIGITLATWLAVRMGLAVLPFGLGLRHVYALSWLAGIGFTMSIFIAGLAFLDAERLDAAKLGVLTASTVAGGVGFVLLRVLGRREWRVRGAGVLA